MRLLLRFGLQLEILVFRLCLGLGKARLEFGFGSDIVNVLLADYELHCIVKR